MDHNPVGWFEIYVQDMQRAKAFYEKVLGVELTKLDMSGMPPEVPEMEMWTFPMQAEAAGATGALVAMPGMASGANSVLVYFSCVDCAVESGRVVAAGGTVFKEKLSIGQYGFIALIVDTESNMVGLHSK